MAGEWEDIPSAAPVKAADGWEDVAPQRRASDRSLLGDVAKFGLRSIAGGPLGAAGGMITEHVQKLLDSLAYKAGGAATDLAAPHMAPETAAKLGLAANVGVQALPVLAGGGLATKAAPMMEDAAARIMQSALKPTVRAQTLKQADPAIQTMLEGGYNATKGGAEKLQGHVDALETKITDALASSGATVDKAAVGKRIEDVIQRVGNRESTPQASFKEAQDVYMNFMDNGLIPKDIPVQKAQELKRGIYEMLREKYGKLGTVEEQAQKALGRGYKETMAEAVPSIAEPLAEQSALLRALKLVERRAMVDSNSNPVSLPTSIAAAVHNPAAMMGLWLNSSNLGKSLLARSLYSGSEVLPFTLGAGTGGIAGALSGHNETPGLLQKILAGR